MSFNSKKQLNNLNKTKLSSYYQLGQDILNVSTETHIARDIMGLSQIVVGLPNQYSGKGELKVYGYSSTCDAWYQSRDSVIGQHENGYLGSCVSANGLSYGDQFMASGSWSSGNGQYFGHTEYYYYRSDYYGWYRYFGGYLVGEINQGRFGSSISYFSSTFRKTFASVLYYGSTGTAIIVYTATSNQSGFRPNFDQSTNYKILIADDNGGYSPSVTLGGDYLLGVGALNYNNSEGKVELYEYSVVNDTWNKIKTFSKNNFAEPYNNLVPNYIGRSIAIKISGSEIFIAISCSLYTKVFKCDKNDPTATWYQVGPLIPQACKSDKGMAFSIDKIVIGDYTKYSNKGSVKIYEYKNNEWIQIGDELIGNVNEQLGYSVALSEIGHIFAVCGKMSGRVSVYSFVAPPDVLYKKYQYIITSDKEAVARGSSVTFTISSNSTDSFGVSLDNIGVPYELVGRSSSGTYPSVYINGGVGTITFNISNGVSTAYPPDQRYELTIKLLDHQCVPSKIVTILKADDPTYILTSDVDSVNERSFVTFNLTTTNILNNTLVPYTITGVSTSDINAQPLNGNFTVMNSNATLALFITADSLTEGAETLTVTAGGVSKSVTINDTSLNVPPLVTYTLTSNIPVVNISGTNYNIINEGDTFTYFITTNDTVPDNTLVPYTISPYNDGIASVDIGGASFTGNFVIVNKSASVTFTATSDFITESQFEGIRFDSAGNTIWAFIYDKYKSNCLPANSNNTWVIENKDILICSYYKYNGIIIAGNNGRLWVNSATLDVPSITTQGNGRIYLTGATVTGSYTITTQTQVGVAPPDYTSWTCSSNCQSLT